jgi:hypothetical protein
MPEFDPNCDAVCKERYHYHPCAGCGERRHICCDVALNRSYCYLCCPRGPHDKIDYSQVLPGEMLFQMEEGI